MTFKAGDVVIDLNCTTESQYGNNGQGLIGVFSYVDAYGFVHGDWRYAKGWQADRNSDGDDVRSHPDPDGSIIADWMRWKLLGGIDE